MIKKIKKNKLNNTFHTWFDVLPQYCNVVVPIRARLFVPEPEGVHKLVEYDSFSVTSSAYGKWLRSRNIVLSTNTGPTPDKKDTAIFLEGRWWGSVVPPGNEKPTSHLAKRSIILVSGVFKRLFSPAKHLAPLPSPHEKK